MKDIKDMTPIELDAYKYEHRFDEAERVMGKAAADALRKLYDFYGKDWLDWLASLYDPKTGSFYYSNSARDNDQFFPDCESTCQTHFILSYFGLIDVYGGDYVAAYPEKMRKNCLKFITSLQSDVDGYFYHPQWGTDIGTWRRGRDLNSCIDLITRFGDTPFYPTALERLSGTEESRMNLPEHLLSREAMLKYLDELDIRKNSYMFGHTLSSQSSQIKAAGLAEVVCDYINEHQYPDTGLWESELDYRTFSGVLKLGTTLTSLDDYIRYSDKIIDRATEVIMSDEPPRYITYVYNPWGAFSHAINAAKRIESDALSRGETPTFSVKEIREKIYARLPELIDKTIEKLAKFSKPGGSFSYDPHHSQPTTQGVPVSLGIFEGDVNGLACAMHYPMRGMFNVLGMSPIPMGNNEDFLKFRAKIEAAHKAYEEANK